MGNPAYNFSPADFPPDEDLAAEEAADQTSHLTVMDGGEGTADTAAADTAVADTAIADTAVAETTTSGGVEIYAGEAATTGEGISLVPVAAAAAFLKVLTWESDSIGPEWPNGRPPEYQPPVQTCPLEEPLPNPLPNPLPKDKDDKKRKRRYTVAIHAQGTDCGGKSSSTIGAPAVTEPDPIPVFIGLVLSAATQALLNQSQRKIREKVIAKAHEYIKTGPAKGGRFGKKSFPVLGVRGGIRYDVDCHGDGPSFVS